MNPCEVIALRHMDDGTRLFTTVISPETTTTYICFISLQQGRQVCEGQVLLAQVPTKEADLSTVLCVFMRHSYDDVALDFFFVFPLFFFLDYVHVLCHQLFFLLLLYAIVWHLGRRYATT